MVRIHHTSNGGAICEVGTIHTLYMLKRLDSNIRYNVMGIMSSMTHSILYIFLIGNNEAIENYCYNLYWICMYIYIYYT